MQSILPKIEDKFSLAVEIEYSADDEAVNMRIKYTGEILILAKRAMNCH